MTTCGVIDKETLRKNARKYYQFNNSGSLPTLVYRTQPEHLKSPEGDMSNRGKMIYIFENTSPLRFLQDRYTCKFVPFSTGVFAEALNPEDRHYTISHDSYPTLLWKTIESCIKG